ncbi:hypothetical protein [Streptomyces virginiae]
MLPKSKADLYAAIRRDARQGLYGGGFLTVKKALSSAQQAATAAVGPGMPDAAAADHPPAARR